MRIAARVGLGSMLVATIVALVACEGAGTDEILGAATGLLAGSEADPTEGINLAADPPEVRLDPCDPDAPTDPDTGKLLGKTSIGAVLLDADLQPIAGANVVFSTTTGTLQSMGQPETTDDKGLATDVLALDEDDVGEVIVTATSENFTNMLSVPVDLVPEPPLTLEMQPEVLWPPNHKLRDVTAVLGGLDCGPAPTVELVSVTSNEADNGNGDGNTDDDIQGADVGTADTQFRLRAERAGGGSGRVYEVIYRITDADGVETMLTSAVEVPHDQGG